MLTGKTNILLLNYNYMLIIMIIKNAEFTNLLFKYKWHTIPHRILIFSNCFKIFLF